MVEVRQEDREAVRAFHAKALGLAISGNEANRLLTEAFARHRIAAENAALEIAKEHGLMAVNMILTSGLPGGTRTQRAKAQAFAEGYSQCAANIATAIRALEGPTDDPA